MILPAAMLLGCAPPAPIVAGPECDRPVPPQVVVAHDAWAHPRARLERTLTEIATGVWERVDHGVGPVLVVESHGGPSTARLPADNPFDHVVSLAGKQHLATPGLQFGRLVCEIALGHTPADRRYEAGWLQASACQAVALDALPARFVHHLDRLARDARTPPPDRAPAWFAARRQELSARPRSGRRNTAIALQLLSLFHEDRGDWGALRHLPPPPPWRDEPVEHTFEAWYLRTPPDHRPFVEQAAARFGLELWSRATCLDG